MVSTVLQDVRFALRLLRRSPVFTLTAALSLAIGIGANTTIFSVASALLLRPLPGLADAGRLVDIGRTQHGSGFDTTSYPNYRDVRDRVTTLSGVYALRLEPRTMSLSAADGADRAYGTFVSGNYFQVLGTEPQAGRLFSDADDTVGRNAVVVLSDELWRRRFAASPSVVGTTITVNGQPCTVIGVAPRGFQGTTLMRSDMWMPLSANIGGPDMFTNRAIVWLIMGGRLKPGVSVARADAELRSIGDTLAREYPKENESRSLAVATSSLVPGRIGMVGGFLTLLMGIVSLILLIACVNLAGMLLARAAARRREIAVRLAIGAARVRLVRQLITETSVLFIAGCIAGLLISRWLTELLLAVLPQLPVPVGVDITIDWRVTAFAIAMSLVAAVLCGLAPALQTSRPALVPALKAQGMDTGGGRLRLRNAFLVGQVTLSLLLVVTAGLFVRALAHASNIDPGFDVSRVDVVSIDPSLAGYKDAAATRFASDLLERTRALPGIQAAALAVDLPLDGGRMSFGDVRKPGAPKRDLRRTNTPPVDWNLVSPGFFSTLHIRLVRGRDFSESDNASAPKVAIVNQALARQFWGEADPIGQQIEVDAPFDKGSDRLTVVGVAADAQLIWLGSAPTPYIYAPLAQRYNANLSLLVKTAGPSAIPQVRALVRQLDRNLPITFAMPLADVTALGLIPQRIGAAVAGTLGIVGLLLAAIGIYGVTSYTVASRTREIGVRMALGAGRGAVMSLVLRQSGWLVGLGLLIGLGVGAAAAQLLRSLLFGISALDPITFAAASAVFALVAALASYLPARRAIRIDPLAALRTE